MGYLFVYNIDLYNISCFLGCSHADTNMVELGETIKDDEQSALMEGGLAKASTTKLPGPSTKTNMIRLALCSK